MRLLPATHTFLWFGLDAGELSAKALDLISDIEVDAICDQYGVERLW